MAKTRIKTAAITVPVPQNDAQAEQMIARLGALELDWNAAKAFHKGQIDACAREVADLKEAFAPREAAFNAEWEAIRDGLNVYATANRHRLTNGGRTKTVQFATGKVFWKEGSPSIDWGKLKNAEVVERVQARLAELVTAIADETKRSLKSALRNEQLIVAGFIEASFKPSKTAMGNSPDIAVTIPGITFVQPGEAFSVEPLATQISEVA